MKFDLEYSAKFDIKNWCVVINCGNEVKLPDGTTLGNFQTGLFKDIEFEGEKLLIIEIGDLLEVSDDIADCCKKNWTHAYDTFKDEGLKDADIFFAPEIKLGEYSFNFIYFGEKLLGRIHKEHDFFELHTQILGKGMMQKFHNQDENTVYETQLLNPGQIHKPFCDKDGIYPWHRYKSISRSIFLAIKSQHSIPHA